MPKKNPFLLEVQQSLQKCYTITQQAKSSFSPSFRFLPNEKRQGMEVLYAFMRYTDDLVDLAQGVSPEEIYANLDDWQQAIDWALTSSLEEAEPQEQNEVPPPTPFPRLQELQQAFPQLTGVEILPALRYTVDRFGIPLQVFSEVLYGVRSDVVPARFREYEDCADYCHAVATSVGVASVAIWGTKKDMFAPDIVKKIKACGIAVQLTNIVRDLIEDLRNERFYLPQEELQLAALTEKQILSLSDFRNSGGKAKKNFSQAERFAENEFQSQLDQFYTKFDRFIAKELDRIETHYLIASELYEWVNRDSRKAFGMIWDAYYRLYLTIRKNPRAILDRKVKLGFFQKLRLALRWTFFPPRHLSGTVR